MIENPPLNALAAFEAAARLGSFTRAGEELCVTQAAVSQHIRHLEDYLGVPLFIRRAPGIRLTPDGERYYLAVSGALDTLRRESARLRRGVGPLASWLLQDPLQMSGFFRNSVLVTQLFIEFLR